MTTQNITQVRYTFANLTQAASPYFYPQAAGMNLDGFDHFSVRAQLVSGDLNNTVTMTVESDDGITATFPWDESRGMYDWITNARGAASWIATNATVRCRLQATNHNARLWRVRIVIVDGAAPNNSGILVFRGIKV